jgi:hypothetical protein
MVAAVLLARTFGRVIEARPRRRGRQDPEEAAMRKHRDFDDLPGFHRHA